MLTIGRIAESAGVGVQTLRFYEREGLIDAPARTSSGYRTYDETVIARLKFIQRAQNLGFTLKEIRELITLHYKPETDCSNIKQVALAKLNAVQQKIDDLERMRATLHQLVASCSGGSSSDCSVMHCFTNC
jgi:MerR family transcriptional regulator, copper efflux regulator